MTNRKAAAVFTATKHAIQAQNEWITVPYAGKLTFHNCKLPQIPDNGKTVPFMLVGKQLQSVSRM